MFASPAAQLTLKKFFSVSSVPRQSLLHCSRSLFPTRLYRFHPWNRTYGHPALICGPIFLLLHLTANKLVDLRRVGLAFGHFHYLADKEAHHFIFTAF